MMSKQEIVTKEQAFKCLEKLIVVFPDTPDAIFETIVERAIANMFSVTDLTNAVTHVIDNHTHGRLFVGSVIRAVRPAFLGPGEWLEGGKRYYGTPDNATCVPIDMPPRPNTNCYFDRERGKWSEC